LAKRLANLVDDGVSPDRMLRIPEFPDDWGEAGMDGKRAAGEKGDRGRKIGRARSPSTQWMDFMPLCWGG
ncbi:MAG: hypothetical protein LBK41_09205, partial [Clostridiales bacterium]|nr:hypothetical protein [Clostridiales bacterium]